MKRTFKIAVSYRCAREKGQRKGRGEKKEEGEGGGGMDKGDERIACPASIRFATKGLVSCLRRACHAQEVRAVYRRGRGERYQTLQNFSFLSPSLVHRPFARKPLEGKARLCRPPSPLVEWLSRLINRYAILNFPKKLSNNPPLLPIWFRDSLIFFFFSSIPKFLEGGISSRGNDEIRVFYFYSIPVLFYSILFYSSSSFREYPGFEFTSGTELKVGLLLIEGEEDENFSNCQQWDYNRTSDANYVHEIHVATFSSGFFSITGGRALKRQLKRDTISLGGLATTYRARVVAKFRGDRARISRSINIVYQPITNKWRK